MADCTDRDDFKGVLHNDLMRRHFEVCAERDRYKKALEEIARETGTPYSHIALKALGRPVESH